MESSHLEIGTHDILSQGMCSDLQDKEVEVYLLNSSFEKVQAGHDRMIKRATYMSMKFSHFKKLGLGFDMLMKDTDIGK